ncbi:MAG: ATP-binding cassette domain-containing protein [Polyangiaceae bacterium]|nr:ATP-binding cassette domain-containing protein [Polyangiaceae bacterium]MCE7892848.1 ATP-binding cassette domain-containing protein [Sorangiineae bacterium PRO1]MCL4751874.1 ATP-binding cassette domain-containing protein [Myxococcales bacterium]
MSAVVEASLLEKRYADFVAVAGIDFRIDKGECFGFLGPNGAGKTSTMRMLQSVSLPSAGKLRVLGMDPSRDGKLIRARIGVCPQADNLDPDLLAHQNLLVYGRYFPQPKAVTARRADELLDFVALGEKRDAPIPELSGGMKRRLVIARALINDPELLLLDEPTTGLDPQARHLIWSKLRELRARGVTMVLTTHYMDEAERLCDRLVIMDSGKILAEGAPRALIETHVGQEVFELGASADEARAFLAELDLGGAEHEHTGDVLAVFLGKRSELSERLMERARQAGSRYLLRNATLEDVFLKLTGRELGE